jgi:hypothetical protein
LILLDPREWDRQAKTIDYRSDGKLELGCDQRRAGGRSAGCNPESLTISRLREIRGYGAGTWIVASFWVKQNATAASQRPTSTARSSNVT